MKKLLYLLAFLPFVAAADPRFPLPETASQIWQNDQDLRDDINKRVSPSDTGYCIDDPTFCVDISSNVISVEGVIRSTAGTLSTPVYSYIDDPDTGHRLNTAGNLQIVTDGTSRGQWASTGLQISGEGQLLASSGTLANPGMSFSTDLNSGIYLTASGSDNVGIVAGGVEIATFTTTAVTVTTTTVFPTGTTTKPSVSFAGDLNTGFTSASADTLSAITAGAEAISINSIGAVTQALQPSVLALSNTTQDNVTGDGTAYTVVFADEIIDQNNDFDGTSTFTAPITGQYLIIANVTFNVDSDHDEVRYLANAVTSNLSYNSGAPLGTTATGVNFAAKVSVIADMDANDTVTISITVEGGTKDADLAQSGNTYLSVSLIN